MIKTFFLLQFSLHGNLSLKKEFDNVIGKGRGGLALMTIDDEGGAGVEIAVFVMP